MLTDVVLEVTATVVDGLKTVPSTLWVILKSCIILVFTAYGEDSNDNAKILNKFFMFVYCLVNLIVVSASVPQLSPPTSSINRTVIVESSEVL